MKNQMVKERVMDELVKTSTMNELMIDSAPIAKKSIKKSHVVIIQTKGRTRRTLCLCDYNQRVLFVFTYT